MPKVLITGGKGFIGKNLTDYLKNRGFQVENPSSKEFNVLKFCDLEQCREKGIEHIIHLAGKTFVPDSWKEPENFLRINVLGTLKVIELCKELGVGMTYVSAYIYGSVKDNPIAEDAPVLPNNPYAKSKYIAEELCEFFCDYLGMDISVLRLFNVYGPGQNEKFLIPYIIRQTMEDINMISVQDLKPKRDYIYIEDVCRAIEISIYRTKGYHLFNVGSGESHSVLEVIELVQKIAGTNKSIVAKDNVRKNEINDVIADINKIQQEWGWVPVVSLENGLKKCMEEAV